MSKIALITCDDLSDFVTDEEFLEKALEKQGLVFEWIPWRESRDWSSFDCAIVRTPWDYADSVDLFLQKMKEIESSSCRLINSFSTIQWNANKTYLNDLNASGVATVPTLWLEIKKLDELQGVFERLECEKIVIKPQVGAGGVDTFLLQKNQVHSEISDIENILNRKMMAQPFFERVVSEGEYSAHFFGGELSHLVLKKPKAGEFKSQEEYGSFIVSVEPRLSQVEFSKDVLAKTPEPCFYGRVDFVYDSQGKERLMELELIEPSLYFRKQEGSADFFVKKLMETL